jgi:Ca2+-binding EF-hand superfamily protein
VSVNLDELGIDTNMFDELKALYEMFDLDRDGVLNLAEFEKVLRALGRSCSVVEMMLTYFTGEPCLS